MGPPFIKARLRNLLFPENGVISVTLINIGENC